MIELLRRMLPLALGMALSPVPVVAVIVFLLSASTTRPGVGFLFGWVSGTALGLTGLTVLSSALPPRPRGLADGVGEVLQIVLGVTLILLGLGQWWARRRRSGPSRWLAAATGLTAPRAWTVGLALAVASPKTLAIGLAAGLELGSATAGPLSVLAAGAVYTLVAVSSVALPVVARVILGDRVTSHLDAAQRWLAHHDHVLIAVVSGLLGTTLLLRAL